MKLKSIEKFQTEIPESRLAELAAELVDEKNGSISNRYYNDTGMLSVHSIIYNRLMVMPVVYGMLANEMLKILQDDTRYLKYCSDHLVDREFEIQEVIDLVTLMLDLAPIILGFELTIFEIEHQLFLK